jgi:hypothetical protein
VISLQVQLSNQDDSHTQTLQSTKDKLQQLLNEQKLTFESQLVSVCASKDHEIALLQSDLIKHSQECDKLAQTVARLQLEKHALEQEVNSFGEQRAAMGKYDWQMTEILGMLADEKQVRGHLRALAGKLIEEVDALKVQTSVQQQGSGLINGLSNGGGQNLLGSSLNGPNSNVRKNFRQKRN